MSFSYDNKPTSDERLFFDANGYLLIKDFLPKEMVLKLTDTLTQVMKHRRQKPKSKSVFKGNNTRIFGLLEDDPLFLDLMDYPPIMSYVRTLLNPEANYHASDAIWEVSDPGNKPGWHRDGLDSGFSRLKPHVPFMQIKVGYFLSDMSAPNQGNLTIMPASHHMSMDPLPEHLADFNSMPGAMQICAPAGACVMFHNGIWHTPGQWTASRGERVILYYAYEHPWMMAARQPRYSRSFYQNLSTERKKMFHEVMFEVK